MKKANTAVVGRTLRRYLGALLALGFGASWWSFVPPARAASPVAIATPRARRVAPHPHVAPPIAVAPTTDHKPTIRIAKLTPHPHRPHVVHHVPTPPPIIDPLPVSDPQPVALPLPDVTLPVGDPPVTEPVLEPIDNPIRLPVPTRSS